MGARAPPPPPRARAGVQGPKAGAVRSMLLENALSCYLSLNLKYSDTKRDTKNIARYPLILWEWLRGGGGGGQQLNWTYTEAEPNRTTDQNKLTVLGFSPPSHLTHPGGNMTLVDLADYTAIWTDVETLEGFSPSDYTVYSSKLTSSGPYLQFMLRTLDGTLSNLSSSMINIPIKIYSFLWRWERGRAISWLTSAAKGGVGRQLRPNNAF